MEIDQHFDVPYSPLTPSNTFNTFDVYLPLQVPHTSALVCFIHGGAWRSEDKADYVVLARALAISTGYPVAVPNYRLTPREPTPDDYLHHPTHAQDILRFLEFVPLWHTENGGRLPQKPSKLVLIGHSCSAHMLCTIFLRMPGHSESVPPPDELIQSTAAIIMSEGIYDIDLLLSSFPEYRTLFIENTFGRKDSYENVSAMRGTINPKGQHIRWLLIHSKKDSLVDERQSQGMYSFLKEKQSLVSMSLDDLNDEHNDILNSPRYIEIINAYIKGVVCVVGA